jgi:O-antigen ligase
MVSGRRAFWLLAIVTPVMVWGLFFLARTHIRAQSVAFAAMLHAIVVAGGVLGLGLDFGVIFEQTGSAFDPSAKESASLRYQQFEALMAGWSNSPLIGQGLGASADSVVRSEEQPWAYELSYVALLFQVGLLGFIIYSSAVLWIFYAGLKIVRLRPDAAQIILPLLAGLAGLLLVNITNPYLFKFDYLWTIFLPVAAINAYRTEE